MALTQHRSYPKQTALRNEDLRRAVSLLPCVLCGICGYTQAAHIGGLEAGKGIGLKVSDSHIGALCTLHPGPGGKLVQGCHEKFDQHKLGPGLEATIVMRTYIGLMEKGLLKVVLP
jgi:hypothetical protein